MKRHLQLSAFSAFALCSLLLLGLWLLPSLAGADPLETGPVEEATAPITETAEQAVPPPITTTAPETVIPLPEAPAPEPQVPEAPVTTPPATGILDDPAPAGGGGAVEEVEETAAGPTGSVPEAVGAETPDPSTVTSAATGAARPGAGEGAAEDQPGSGASAPAGSAGQAARPPTSTAPLDLDVNLPPWLLHPFIRVWPAVALLTDGPLARFLGDWSGSVLVVLAKAATGSPGAGAEALRTTDGTPAAADPEAHLAAAEERSAPSGSPPSVPPFNWIADQGTFPLVLFLLLVAMATLTIALLLRHELGAPLLPRRITHWWRSGM